jgi:DNA-binding protein YbaB
MFDMFGNIQQKQEEIQQKLAEIILEEQSEDGAVIVKSDANRKILDIHLNPEKLAPGDLEQIEDLVLITVNKVLERAEIKAAAEARKVMNDMLPPGLGGLGDLFGG